ncbi:hypothetical protein T4D_15619 [Trichinella pseudospiralis]|uniref:Uncharacterized protein n=1 Tax=Trichinella pseudospiralis TaxID=6337 RepID=A0A0V1FL65_TRIPS|nr:hypothetical protein T4D_15619 [Trichinella pseudospiralis]
MHRECNSFCHHFLLLIQREFKHDILFVKRLNVDAKVKSNKAEMTTCNNELIECSYQGSCEKTHNDIYSIKEDSILR